MGERLERYLSLVQCPQCQERLVADRLKDHLRYQHTTPRERCDHCGEPLVRDDSRGHGKRFCNGRCQSLNYQAMLRARRALEEYKSAHSLTSTPPP